MLTIVRYMNGNHFACIILIFTLLIIHFEILNSISNITRQNHFSEINRTTFGIKMF